MQIGPKSSVVIEIELNQAPGGPKTNKGYIYRRRLIPLTTDQHSLNSELASNADSTIGMSPIGTWAKAHAVHDELRFFAHCLRIEGQIQADYLGSALDGLAHCAETIRSWGTRGQETFGLELLADQWRQTKAWLGKLPERAITHSPLEEFRGTADSHYLHLLVHSKLLDGPQARAQLVLRSWALLRAHEFAAAGTLQDPYLRQLCTNLRIAAYESTPDWGPVISALVVRDQTLEMVAADLQAKSSDVAGRMPVGSLLQPKHLAFLTSMNTLAARKPPKPQAVTGPWRSGPPVPQRNALSRVPTGPADEPSPEPAQLLVEAEGEIDTHVAYVDSQASPRQQEHDSRSIYFTTALDASLVRWSWSKPSPHEASSLREKVRIAVSDESSQFEHRLLAAIVWIALFAGRTLDEACRMAVDDAAPRFSQWALELQSGILSRKVPRREAHWRPDSETARFVHPPADAMGWQLPDAVLRTLTSAARSALRPKYLRDIWTTVSSLPVDQAFRGWVQRDPSTDRLRPWMLANVLRQDVFERTNDSLLARLLGSRDREALPSAAAYGTYLSTVLLEAVGLAPTIPQVTENIGGSLLAPTSDELLRSGFRRAHDELLRLRSDGSWVEIHNMTVLYWDAALRAATGIRPNNAIWTNHELIDWTHAFVYVDEKASPLLHSGRLVPIPRDILNTFHREFVCQQLPAVLGNVQQLGIAYDANTAGNLLFLIQDNGHGATTCAPVTQRDRERLGIEGSFPLNVFRHRMRTGLQRLGADPEVIDSVLGHTDGSSATHGPYSMRTWSNDIDKLRPALSTLLGALDIKNPPTPKPVLLQSAPVPTVGRSDVAAGPRSRLRTARFAITEARTTISEFLKSKLGLTGDWPLPQGQILEGLVGLTDIQVDELEKLLTLTSKGMPSTTGALRHAYLVKLARRAWDELEKPVRLRRRLRPVEVEASAYTADAAGAMTRHSRLKVTLDQLFEARPYPSHVSFSDAHVLVTIDLIASSRITSARVLAAPLEAKVNCRLARIGASHYLEWSPDASLAERPDAPIQRFLITGRTARLLEDLLKGGRRVDVQAGAAGALRALQVALDLAEGSTFEVVRAKAASLVAQCNVIELPGSVAGYLNGSLMTAALGQADFVRFRCQTFVRAARVVIPDKSYNDPPLALGKQTTTDTRTDPTAAQRAARHMLRDVSKELERLRTPDASRHRQQGLNSLRLDVSGNREVSTTIRLLCLWALERLQNEDRERPLSAVSPSKSPLPAPEEGKRKRRRVIQTVSARRYLSALKPIFIDLASDVDILSMESEELLDFYQAVLGEGRVQNLNYLYRRLRDFHRFSMRHGAADVDWSELVPANAPDLGAPGFIDEAAYQQILAALETTTPPPGVHSWQLQVFAVLCYRFGLRGGEALHLRQADWRALPDGSRVVLVQPRRFHKLKSAAARRQVPLVFPLSEREEAALRQLQRHHQVAAIGVEHPPLLGAADDPQRAVADAIVRQHLNQVIKAVTGQGALSLHDMRHSLACRIWQALESPQMPQGATENCLREDELVRLRETLLGPNAPPNSRRAAWVLANLLGHATPATTMRSYVHFVAEAAEAALARSIKVIAPWPKSNTKRLANIDLLQLLERVPQRAPETPLLEPPRSLTPELALDALVHLSRGDSPPDTAAALHVSVDAVNRLHALAARVHDLLGSNPNRTPKTARAAPQGLLSRIAISSFQRLRVGLASLEPVEPLNDGLHGLADAHILGMVGPDRQLNMWTKAQMSFVARLIRGAEVDSGRLVLVRSPTTLPSLLRAAQEAGLLSAQLPAVNRASQHALCTRLVTKPLPSPAPIAPLDIRISNRLVLELAPARDGWIHDRVELWISLVCVKSCTLDGARSHLFDPDIQ